MGDRCRRILFVISVLGLSWLGMMATHEFGHVTAAKLTGGTVVRVELHPATISRTDVTPNPSPLFVAWAGPILGCLIPGLVALAVRQLTNLGGGELKDQERTPNIDVPPNEFSSRSQGMAQPVRNFPAAHRSMITSLLQFFAGFCFIANGAYLGVGVFDRVGDAGEILKAGNPPWILIVFGLIAFVAGIAMWHRLGSPLAVLRGQVELDSWLVRGLTATLLLVIVVECVLSPV